MNRAGVSSNNKLTYEAQRLISWYSNDWTGRRPVCDVMHARYHTCVSVASKVRIFFEISVKLARNLNFIAELQRNEFLHKFLLKLDPRQHYFISSFLAVSLTFRFLSRLKAYIVRLSLLCTVVRPFDNDNKARNPGLTVFFIMDH